MYILFLVFSYFTKQDTKKLYIKCVSLITFYVTELHYWCKIYCKFLCYVYCEWMFLCNV